MFETLEMAPPDPILGLSEAFQNDPEPRKINLSVGVFKDASGRTPVLSSVKKAERLLLEEEETKSYKPIQGAPEFGAAVRSLLFGATHDVLESARALTAHCPGGTGALRVAANWIGRHFPGATVWLSDPTWANHGNIFAHAGVPTRSYPYFDPGSSALDAPRFLAALREVPSGDVVLLHGCCHNPTGVDPSPSQWEEIAAIVAERGILPLVDFAYQGFGVGLEPDAAGLRSLARPGVELLVASSFSKNFGLYNERVGALTLVARSSREAEVAFSQLKAGIRANYSNPPAHGAAIVTRILRDAALRSEWEGELSAMRDRIHAMRERFVETLREKGVDRDFSFLARQNGMFSFSGLTRDQVEALRRDFSIYIVGSGRINVAGMTESNMDRLCEAIRDVLHG